MTIIHSIHHPVLQITVQEKQVTKTTAIELGALLRNQEIGASKVIVWYQDTDTKTPLALTDNHQIVINETLLTALSQVQGVEQIAVSYQHPAGA